MPLLSPRTRIARRPSPLPSPSAQPAARFTFHRLTLAALSFPAAALAALSFPAAALADPAPAPATSNAVSGEVVTEIIITANPLGRTADDLVQPSSVLSGEELERARRGTLGETLQGQPGVSTTDFGAGAGRPVIRGLAGPRVEMLENGLSAMDVSDLSPDHGVTISPAQARQIEVLKGPAPLLYGNSAAGGVVNVDNGRLPRQVTEGLHGAFDSYYGANADEGAFGGELNYGRGAHMLHADYGFREAGDYRIPGAAQVDGGGSRGRLDNSRLRAQSGAASYSHISESGNVFGLGVGRYTTNYGLPVEENAFVEMKQTRVDAQVILDKPLRGLESFKFRGGTSNYAHTEFEAKGEPGTRFHNQQYQGRVEAVHEPLFGFRGVFGLQFNWRDFSASGEEAYVPPVYSRQAGLFFVEEKPFGFASGGKLEFGARIDRNTNTPEQGDAERPLLDRDYTPVSASLGASFDVGTHAHLKFYATHAERSPAPEELYAYGPHHATQTFERGKLDAKKESANNIELGFDLHHERWALNASVYYNRIRRFLYLAEVDAGLDADGSGTLNTDGIADRLDEEGVFDPEGELLLVDYRQANARLYGFEAELNYAWLQSGPMQLSTRLFADHVRARLTQGSDLPRMPPLRIGAGIDARWQRWSGSLDYTRALRQRDTGPLESETAGYNLLDADLRYTFLESDTRSASIYLRANNLLDDEIRRSTSFIKDEAPAPGRSLYLGLRLTL